MDGMITIKDKTLLLLSFIGAAAFVFLNLVEHKPNRISPGEPYSSFELFGSLSIVLLIVWGLFIGLSFVEPIHKNKIIFALTTILVITLFWFLLSSTEKMINKESSARISLSAGFYVQLFCIYMFFSTYTERIKNHTWIKWIGLISIIGSFYYFISTGAFTDLSLVKEYTIKKDQFYDHLRIHALLTFASVITGALIAIPLGFLAYSKKKLEDKVMVPLSIIETIPTFALFGVLLVPLAGLGNLPFFDQIGVSGIGWAPAYVALTLYTLLPIGRNTLTGFHSVDTNVIEAAKGMGMSNRQVLQKIELPLAFPVIFTGIRIAFIQTIGGAVLAGLVGGGGLGTFVFLGLGEASPDLILLGVLPIVFFTVLLDYMLRTTEKIIRGMIYD